MGDLLHVPRHWSVSQSQLLGLKFNAAFLVSSVLSILYINDRVTDSDPFSSFEGDNSGSVATE